MRTNKYVSTKCEVQRTKKITTDEVKRRSGTEIMDPMQPNDSPENKPFDLCERTFKFALEVVKLCQRIDRHHSNAAWTLSKQLLRSATSVGANVEEAQGAQSRADFASKYSIARKEVRETSYWLRLLLSSGILEPAEGKPLLAETGELLRILTTIIKKVRCD
jgi:four helix bundle protein